MSEESCWIRCGDINVCVDCGAVRPGAYWLEAEHAPRCERGRPVDHDTPDEHEVNPYHAVSPLEEHAPEPATDMKLVVVMWGGDDWTKSFAATFPATMTGGAVVESALEQIQEKVRIGEVKPGRVKSVTVNDLPTPTVTP